MILYQDADSMVKRYMHDEHGLAETTDAVDRADLVATSLIAHAEVRSALTRARRARRLRSQAEYERAVSSFTTDWRNYYRINVSNTLVVNAGELAEKHALRGADSIHLASAIALGRRTDESVEFSTWDKDLATAATAEGLSLAHEVTT